MKLPILVLCVAVLYGASRIYAEEDVNLKTDVTDIDWNISKNEGLFLKKPLSRQRRSLLSSPMDMLLNMLGKNSPLGAIVKNVLDLSGFVLGALTGQKDLCPKVEIVSLELIGNILTHPIETIKIIICYIVQMIGNQGRTIALNLLKMGMTFVRKVAMPSLHKALNTLKDNVPLPSSINNMIVTFNLMYTTLNLLGLVG